MANNRSISDINLEKILIRYRRYRFAKFLITSPIARTITFIIAGLLLIIIWPFALIHMTVKVIRFARKTSRNYKKRSKIIDL